SPYLYFYGVTNDAQGNPVSVNKEMDFTRSLNSAIGYEHFLGPTQRPVRIKSELYYQHIYNVPVDKQPSSFSLLNAGATFTRFYPDTLLNKGKGENYGLEVTVDRNFAKHYLFMINGSLFQSKYTGSDRVKRNTTFNGNYIVNALGTYEWETTKQNVLSVGLRVSTSGGRRHGVIDEVASENKKHVVYVEGTETALQFKPYFKVDFRLSYRVNLRKASHEIVLDMINILNTQNVLRHSYVPAYETGQIGRVEEEYQLGFLPFFYYRVGF
ncbi:MAG: TonB-dependent receptor, partial [Cyclobacteriaceae bacterium]|nr:TonB-dependent receptor [Cyclobacteriaceae bacterium]